MPKPKAPGRGIHISEAIYITAQPKPATTWHDPVIYYLRFRDRVKIGITQQITHRIRAIPNEGLLAVEFGDNQLEHARHSQFGHLRHLGEWFEFGQELGVHIAETREQFELNHGMTTEAWLKEQNAYLRHWH